MIKTVSFYVTCREQESAYLEKEFARFIENFEGAVRVHRIVERDAYEEEKEWFEELYPDVVEEEEIRDNQRELRLMKAERKRIDSIPTDEG